MQLEQTPTTDIAISQMRHNQPISPWRWLMLARMGWIALALLILTLSAIALPRFYEVAQSVCRPGAHCLTVQLTSADLRLLHQLGLSPAFLAAYQTGWDAATVLIYLALGALLFWRRSNDRMALFCAYMLVLMGSATYTDLFDYGLRPLAPATYWLVGAIEFLAQVSFLTFLLLFPSGRFVPRWTRWGVLISALYEVQYTFLRDPLHNKPNALTSLPFAALILSLVALQIYRYRRVSTPVERQQTKWVIFGFSVALVGFALFIFVGNIFLSPATRNSQVRMVLIAQTVTYSLLLLIPLSIAFAILRSHLWDIDVIINRTLLYSALTASVVGLYVLVVGYLGVLFRTSGNPLISLIATGLIAVLFQPLRGWLQRGVNRLTYGQRDEPYAVVAQLGRRLESTLAPEAILPAIVETVAQALKLPYVAISLQQGEAQQIAAAFGTPPAGPLTLPLIYQAEPVGQLLLAPRAPGETFTAADRRLLEDLARQIGIAAHAVSLTSDLQRSRERLVTTREEERRRLRRDLHDGLGSALTSLLFKLDATDTLLEQDTQAARTLLEEVREQMQASISDIRRLVYDLRPPILDEWGLVAALREQIAQQKLDNVRVTIDAPESLPPLPAAVEVAAYRIALESLANVIKHAHAATCTIRLALSEDALTLEVQDDGVGRRAEAPPGVGLIAIRERATELGGTCMVEDVAPHGTCVFARFPLRKAE